MDDLEAELMQAAQDGGRVYWSNFLITVNTNFAPQNGEEEFGVVNYLQDACADLFQDFDSLNGVLIKPAGAPNAENHLVDPDGIVGVRSRVGIEQGAERGFVHAHILVEVCHRLGDNNEFGFRGVHVNRGALQRFFDERLEGRDFGGRHIERVYLNSKLQTRATDNASKYMTIAYLNKDRDALGRNLAAQRHAAGARAREIHAALVAAPTQEVRP